jgi:hypothetical protein
MAALSIGGVCQLPHKVLLIFGGGTKYRTDISSFPKDQGLDFPRGRGTPGKGHELRKQLREIGLVRPEWSKTVLGSSIPGISRRVTQRVVD